MLASCVLNLHSWYLPGLTQNSQVASIWLKGTKLNEEVHAHVLDIAHATLQQAAPTGRWHDAVAKHKTGCRPANFGVYSGFSHWLCAIELANHACTAHDEALECMPKTSVSGQAERHTM